jgi:hypothetical protein
MEHMQPIGGLRYITSGFMGRQGRRNENNFVQSEAFFNFQRRPQVTDMNRIKSTTE